MIKIKGTANKVKDTDLHMACRSCKRMFYFPSNSNRCWIVCPFCEHAH